MQNKNHKKIEIDLKSLPLDELQEILKSSSEGISQIEAQSRLVQYGFNEIAEKKAAFIITFLSYFWGPIPWMIEIALVLSAIDRHWADFSIILVLLFTNVLVRFWQEYQAGNAIAALKKKLALTTKVKRDGKWMEIPSRELVPGDIVRLRLGDIVPGDVRLLHNIPIEVDQSALTGESLPVERNLGDPLFSGSIIRKGEVDAMVYGTGMHTYFGKTVELVEEAYSVSHFQKAILKIGKYLIILATILSLFISSIAIYRGDSVIGTVQFTLILFIAAIPVAMPTVLSITMAIGARLLAKKQAIVTRLTSIEELAGIDILCCDKTGTLTQNKLTIGEIYSIEGHSKEEVILLAALTCREEDKDSIDRAIMIAIKDQKEELNKYQITSFQPFDPVNKFAKATVKGSDKKEFKAIKGAPQVILKMSSNKDETKEKANHFIEEFAAKGFRSLGVARANSDETWEFVGIIPLFDPPREEAKSTIESATEIGIDVKMLTGDQIAIAKETAKKLGLGTNILDAGQLGDGGETIYNQKTIENADGFSEVFPEHKFHIVETLQKYGHIVGMTGDGVNDAPALKMADCGIAVSDSTDAARAAASIVLLNTGLTIIIDGIKESRKIFQRMNTYAIYRIAETLRILFFITFSILVFNFYPITAVMIILLAVLNDGAILSIAYDNVRYQNHPVAWNMKTVLTIATFLGVIGVIASFGLFYLAERFFQIDRSHIQTLMYLKLSIAGHLTIFVTRTRGPFWTLCPAPILLIAVLGTQIIATLLGVYGFLMTPVGWYWALFIWGYALGWFLINDRLKLLLYQLIDYIERKATKENK